MEFTDIFTVDSIRLYDGESNTKAFVDISIADSAIVPNFRVVKHPTQGHLFLGMPQKAEKDKDGNTTYRNVLYVGRLDYKKLTKLVVNEYEQAVVADKKAKKAKKSK